MRRARPRLLVAAAIVLIVAAAALRHAPAEDARRPKTPGVVVASPRTRREAGVARLDRATALSLARRFAAAFAAWDAGDHRQSVAARLGRLTTPGLTATLESATPRPVAEPVRRLRLRPTGAYSDARGRILVPLVRAGASGTHVLTVVVVATGSGPRVAAIHR
jgi:hypothetical protein